MQLTPQEAELLSDLIDYWAGGMYAAYNDTINDRSLADPEEMLDMLEGMREQEATLASIQVKLGEACKLQHS